MKIRSEIIYTTSSLFLPGIYTPHTKYILNDIINFNDLSHLTVTLTTVKLWLKHVLKIKKQKCNVNVKKLNHIYLLAR